MTEKQIARKLASLTTKRNNAYGVYSRARGRNTKNFQSPAEQKASERLRIATSALMDFCREHGISYPTFKY